MYRKPVLKVGQWAQPGRSECNWRIPSWFRRVLKSLDYSVVQQTDYALLAQQKNTPKTIPILVGMLLWYCIMLWYVCTLSTHSSLPIEEQQQRLTYCARSHGWKLLIIRTNNLHAREHEKCILTIKQWLECYLMVGDRRSTLRIAGRTARVFSRPAIGAHHNVHRF